MGLAQSQLLQVPEAVAGELWSRLAPSAALSAADPARRVEVLPYHAAEPLKLAWPDADCSGPYEARVSLVSREEWREALLAACAAAVSAGPGKTPQVGEHRGAADWSRVSSCYGASASITAEALAAPGATEALVASLMERAADKGLGSRVLLSASTEAEFARLVQPYVDSSDEAEGGALWPLVHRATLFAPFSLLSAGLRLYDVPGTHDENQARALSMRSIIASAHTVLITSNIRRACNDKSAKDLMPLPLRRELLQRGSMGELAFVASQADIFNRSELVENLRLDETTPPLQCALARNAFTKRELTKSFTQNVPLASLGARPPPEAWHEAPFKLPVFTVSAVEHRKLLASAGGGGTTTESI
ncbi:hypothetical protein EMIHUDRAFT_448985 [Emiliania huxleyi CCMP1516]|uniref:Uncharacterized protein n=2 Tax=Emiliania huxleyi TaxID=2903 RepID=A0A0D3KQP8_EMIH1|nr:hypothetical protein EMIHUDRAFT_448985 [Emiliania huxleyi CCMP1516]EOD38083.1 hypothetical protein EMIHUDRAFT_448985 [Emiliania huxleyi CCMP1516]|eukprot:XP_005790512.1 hypothetical protein EMIHUDRAFT_448985 [Emiliania huxleyi CCMP1516]